MPRPIQPLASAPAVDLPGERVPAPAFSPGARSASGTGPVRVLVVDDHIPLAAMTRMALEWAGYSVEVAHQGWLALARADRFRPDVVVCDLNLPDLDGTEVAQRMRAWAAGRPLILIACSGDIPHVSLGTLLAAGFDAFLEKPVDIPRLLATIAAAGTGRPTARD